MNMILTSFQRRGWEPDAVLNWLALTGWGTHTEESGDQASKTAAKAPDSTTVMSLPEIVTNVRFQITESLSPPNEFAAA
jgi:glutamyl-tRNA synthetase